MDYKLIAHESGEEYWFLADNYPYQFSVLDIGSASDEKTGGMEKSWKIVLKTSASVNSDEASKYLQSSINDGNNLFDSRKVTLNEHFAQGEDRNVCLSWCI